MLKFSRFQINVPIIKIQMFTQETVFRFVYPLFNVSCSIVYHHGYARKESTCNGFLLMSFKYSFGQCFFCILQWLCFKRDFLHIILKRREYVCFLSSYLVIYIFDGTLHLSFQYSDHEVQITFPFAAL